MDKRKERGIALLGVVAIAAVGAWTFTHLSVTTEITHFIPRSEDRELADIARQMASSDLNRSVTLLVSGPDEGVVLNASRSLVEQLSTLQAVEVKRSCSSCSTATATRPSA